MASKEQVLTDEQIKKLRNHVQSLQSMATQIERLNREMKAKLEEVKDDGLDPTVVKAVLQYAKLKKSKRDYINERENMINLYRQAIGISD